MYASIRVIETHKYKKEYATKVKGESNFLKGGSFFSIRIKKCTIDRSSTTVGECM